MSKSNTLRKMVKGMHNWHSLYGFILYTKAIAVECTSCLVLLQIFYSYIDLVFIKRPSLLLYLTNHSYGAEFFFRS